MSRVTKLPEPTTGISEEKSRALAARSEMFQRITQGRGKPMVYGTGKKGEKS